MADKTKSGSMMPSSGVAAVTANLEHSIEELRKEAEKLKIRLREVNFCVAFVWAYSELCLCRTRKAP